MTKQELKEVLKSKANMMAGAAIDLIKDAGPLQDLAALVASGGGHAHFKCNS